MAEVPLVAGRVINLAERYTPGIVQRYRAGEFAGRGGVQFAGETLSEGSRINWRGIGYAVGAGAVSGGLLGASSLGFKKLMDIDSARSSLGKRPANLPEPLFSKRRKMDQLMVAAGGRGTKNRYQNKQKLKSGRLGRKLQKESAEFIQRWQRIYPFGTNIQAYPQLSTEEENCGTNKSSWFGVSYATTLDKNTGRLMLSHVAPITSGESTKIQLLPGYLFDITTWNNTTDAGDKCPIPMKRLAVDNIGNFQFVQCAQQGADVDFTNLSGNDGQKWFGESGPAGVSLPNTPEQKAVLAWNDIRLNVYGAKKRCTKIHIEFIQFKDQKYGMQFHPDGKKLADMSLIDQQDVKLFWLNEFKRLTFNPLVVNTFIRSKAVKVLKSETFCVNSDENTNMDPGPPVVQKQYFKRYNRLVKWNWQTQNLTLDPVWNTDKPEEGGMENPDFQVTDQAQMVGYAHPRARVYMYIRAEDFEHVAGTAPLSESKASFTTNIAPVIDPAPPGGDSYPTLPTKFYDGVTEKTGNILGEPVGYMPVVTNPTSNPVYTAYMPTYDAANYTSADNHASFDIIVRNKWRTQV